VQVLVKDWGRDLGRATEREKAMGKGRVQVQELPQAVQLHSNSAELPGLPGFRIREA